MLLRARIVYPVTTPPIEDGGVIVAHGRIVALGRHRDLSEGFSGERVDLGDSILLPGLVNAHCHLDYTNLARQIAPPGSFTDWVKQLITLKAGWSYTDYAESWLEGSHQLLDCGTTTVGDIEAVPELLADVLPATPLRVTSFREIITIRSSRSAPRMLDEALADLAHVPAGRHRPGLSPHAPYSTTQELARLTREACRSRGWRWTMHVGESTEERDMLQEGRGPMYDWLRPQRPMEDCGGLSPVGWLERAGALGPELLVAHANHVSEPEASLLASTGVQVVHCPRSHDYFGHTRFPHGLLQRAGVSVCLGTDSLVSVRSPRGTKPVLSLFAEMESFARSHPGVPASDIVAMATVKGGAALGFGLESVGVIAPGAHADLISIPLPEGTREPAEAIVHHPGPVASSLIEGNWVIRPPRHG
ncbi:MAG TPA: hypothetical protein DCM86_11725 [Verrucomicrobiales bacterium]|nr:hypothetical protein [Verrucomicrobiales bacterium]